MTVASQEVSVAGRTLRLSNLDKVLYPEAGFTKAQVIDYYLRVAPVLLPHLADRPLTLKRYPSGAHGEFFYEKNCPPHRPRWVRTTEVPRTDGGVIDYCVANDVASLVWVANLAALELHPALHRRQNLSRPTLVAFDLDPGPPATIVECARVALWLRELLEGLSLVGYPKTSGKKGMQVYVPLNTPRVGYDDTKAFAHAIARVLEQAHPSQVLSVMKRSLRTGKVFVDWSQNDEHKTTVSVYSLRAHTLPTVSTPITWEEVERAAHRRDGSHLVFTTDEVLARVAQQGDLFARVLTDQQRLPRHGSI